MDTTRPTAGVAANRLDAAQYENNFAAPQQDLSREDALEAAEACLFCPDPPCVTACPTDIDIPGFFEQILADDLSGAARTIFDQNILGGICARVCPTDVLCEGACVYVSRDQPPVDIARLQRFATDHLLAAKGHPYERAPSTGRKVAVVGAGPAGLACAHRLALRGHDVVIMDAREKPGGLNEYGVAAYKLPSGFAQTEIAWLLQIGGIELRNNVHLGRDITLDALRETYDAVFLGMGLAGVHALRTDGESKDHVTDAIDFIAELRQAEDPADVPVGQNVVVLGGGRTAVDAAVQARLLGAAQVTIAYRDGEAEMGAGEQERIHAASKGVRIVTGATPIRILGTDQAEAVEFAYTYPDATGLRPGGETFQIKADQVLKAIGQHLADAPGELHLDGSQIATNAQGRTSLSGVWAGGDCTTGERDLTVAAVAQGRDAAEDIHKSLCT